MNHKVVSFISVFLLLAMVGIIGLFVGEDGITGSFVQVVACYDDADCNDHIESTTDICRNPGTEFSLCVNKPKEQS